MIQENYQDVEKLRRELRITRIFSCITSVLLIGLLIGGFIVFSKVQEYAQTVIPLIEKIAEVDFEVLNEAIAGLNTEELSKALENLNNAAETLEQFGNSVKGLFSK